MNLVEMYREMFESIVEDIRSTGEAKNMSAYKTGDMQSHIERNEAYIKKLNSFEGILEEGNKSEEYYKKLSEIYEIMNNYSSDLKDFIKNK